VIRNTNQQTAQRYRAELSALFAYTAALKRARRLPPREERGIEGLTDEEWNAFQAALADPHLHVLEMVRAPMRGQPGWELTAVLTRSQVNTFLR